MPSWADAATSNSLRAPRLSRVMRPVASRNSDAHRVMLARTHEFQHDRRIRTTRGPMHDFDPTSLFPYLPIVDRAPVRWPGGARVAVWIVPNIEHFHLELGPKAPDVRNYSRRDYGNRVGVWRLMDCLTRHGFRGSVALNAEVAHHYPRIMQACGELGWELMGHGLTNSTVLAGMDRGTEEATIAETRRVIEAHGQRMRGWLGP